MKFVLASCAASAIWAVPILFTTAPFTAIASVLVLTGPYLTSGLQKPDDAELVRTYERYERSQGVSDIPLRIEEVSGDTSQANAYAFGMGPTSTIVLWDTLLDGRFTDDSADSSAVAEWAEKGVPLQLVALAAPVSGLVTRRRGTA